jgi:archaellum biogenesis protein FlaJ (TadC family)
MTTRQRKFIGVLLVLITLVAYAVVAVTLGDALLGGAPQPVQLLYFAVAGLGWVVPAGFIIRWMQRPDEDDT